MSFVCKHGMAKTNIYDVWSAMKERCLNKNSKDYPNYGGRGITVCNEWSEFISFYEWAMESGYSKNLTIDRKDNDKGYSPQNCKFSTRKVQNNNKRNNVWYEYLGQRKTIAQWSEFTGILYSTLSIRFRKGWGVEKALLTPIRESYKKIDFDFFEQKIKAGDTITRACADYGITRRKYYYALEMKGRNTP